MGMDFTQRMSERMAPLDSYNADSAGAGTVNGTWVSMENYHRAWLLIDVGDMAGTATLDVILQQASAAAGTGAKAITGKAITQLTQAGGDGNDLLCIELRSEELDVAGGFEYIRFVATVANAAVEMGIHLFGTVSRYEPVPTTNWTEIVD